MKRAGGIYDRISDYENLSLAFWKAARGKQNRPDVIAFRQNYDQNMAALRTGLLNRKPDIGHYRFFRIHDPKPRNICAASFPERVLHHAVMNLCEPVLESYAIHHSYACREGKGNRKALAAAQKNARRFPWFLKLDIRHYFDIIHHEILMDLLARRFKDRDLLHLFRQILNTYHTEPGRGMPIGNLISQHLANFYLGRFDRWVTEEMKAPAYLRYMDDFLVFHREKAALKDLLEKIKIFLAKELALELKSDIQLNRCRCGIPFLGYRVYPFTIRLSRRSRRRFIRKFRLYENRYLTGEWSEEDLCRHMEPLFNYTRAADAVAFRRNVIQRFGASF